jgi:HAD superfamily hydrolase (TIGR01549 family)
MIVKAVIFDLDGTITQPSLDFTQIRQEMGLQGSPEPILEAMQGMAQAKMDRALAILHRHERRAVECSQLNPCVREVLAVLREQGIRVGILTRNLHENALAIGRKHGLEFDGVVGRDDGPAKPDAFGIHTLCRKFRVLPEHTLMVGDYLHDMLCARAAGAVGILLESHEKNGEFAEYASFTIENMSQIIQIMAVEVERPGDTG